MNASKTISHLNLKCHFPIHPPQTPKTASEKPQPTTLAPSVLICAGEVDLSPAITDEAEKTLFFPSLTAETVAKLATEIAAYQPVIFLVDPSHISDPLVDTILAEFSSHLTFKIVLIRSQYERIDGIRCIYSPMLNPCSPISVVNLPSGQERLNFEISNFFSIARSFADKCKKLMRIVSMSDREIWVANLIAGGFSSKEIAKKLCLSEKSIEKCRTDIYKKIGVSSGPELSSLITLKNFFRWPGQLDFPVLQ